MANINGDNYQAAFVDKPSQKYPKGEEAGRKKLLLERHTIGAGGIPLNDVLLCGFIPASSVVTDVKLTVDGATVAGTGDLGYLASADGSIAADADAFLINTNFDSNLAAVIARPVGGEAGIHKRFDKEVQVAFTCTTAYPAGAAGVKITIEIEYVND